MKLLDKEEILEVVSPHPLSFWPYYLFFLYYIVIGGYMYTHYDELLAWITNIISHPLIVEILIMVLWWLILLIPAIIFSLFHVTWRWIAIYVLLGVIGTYAVAKLGIGLDAIWVITAGIGVLGLILSDFYRRSHKYYITNKRIIIGIYSGLLGKQERELLYSKITEVSLKQGVIGRIFNYGTVIPITASGVGTAIDQAGVSVGVGADASKAGVGVGAGVAISGSKSIVSPGGRTWFILYGVPDPERIRDIIIAQMESREEAQYLKRQVELLEKLVEEKEEEKKGE